MIRSKLRVVGLGDSTTAGTPGFLSPVEHPPDGRGNPQSQYAFWMTRLHPGWVVLNRGVNGERTDQVLDRLATDAIRHQPDYLVVLAGVNDVYQGYSNASIEANLSELYRQAATSGARVLVATILPFNIMTHDQATAIRMLNRWIAARAEVSSLLFCDTNRVVADRSDPDRLAGSPDGLHPDLSGYRKMGEAIARVIETAEGGS